MQRSIPFSHRSLSSVPYLFFTKITFPSFLWTMPPPTEGLAQAAEKSVPAWGQPLSPLQKRGQHPLTAACLFCLGGWVCSGCSEGSGPPESTGLSLFAEPPGGSNHQSLAAIRVPGLPGQRLCRDRKCFLGRNLLLCSCLPALQG